MLMAAECAAFTYTFAEKMGWADMRMLLSPSVVSKPHILVPKGAAQYGSHSCSGKSPVAAMLIRIFKYKRGG